MATGGHAASKLNYMVRVWSLGLLALIRTGHTNTTIVLPRCSNATPPTTSLRRGRVNWNSLLGSGIRLNKTNADQIFADGKMLGLVRRCNRSPSISGDTIRAPSK